MMPTVTKTNTILSSQISVIDHEGNALKAEVELTVDDFKTFSMQESVTLEDHLDAATFAKIMNGDITAADFAASPKLCRVVFYAKVRAAVDDRRVREAMSIEDFDLDLAELGKLLQAIAE